MSLKWLALDSNNKEPKKDFVISCLTRICCCFPQVLSTAEPEGEFDPLELILNTAMQKFDSWMKARPSPSVRTHAEELLHWVCNEELVDWMNRGSYGNLITNFEEFIALADKLNKNGYQIEIVITKDQFNEEMLMSALMRSGRFEEIEPSLGSIKDRLDKAAQSFDFWMKKHHDNAEKMHSTALIDWIREMDEDAHDFFWSKNYYDLILLAVKLNGMGYRIKLMPTKEDFGISD